MSGESEQLHVPGVNLAPCCISLGLWEAADLPGGPNGNGKWLKKGPECQHLESWPKQEQGEVRLSVSAAPKQVLVQESRPLGYQVPQKTQCSWTRDGLAPAHTNCSHNQPPGNRITSRVTDGKGN